jgi:hypothetical protein
MGKIVLTDWMKVNDEFMAFMFGLDDDVEKVIIRFLFDKKCWVSFQEIKCFAIDKSWICHNQSTLSRRLTSLTNFKIIDRRTEHDNKTFYRINENFIQELLDKKEVFY